MNTVRTRFIKVTLYISALQFPLQVHRIIILSILLYKLLVLDEKTLY